MVIFEGISESISENWEEFEEAAEETKEECRKYFRENKKDLVSIEDVKIVAKSILKTKLGDYSITFAVDRKNIELGYNLGTLDISEAIYDCVNANFGINDDVLRNINATDKEKK